MRAGPFSIWTKIPDPGSSYPWSTGNLDVYFLIGANWYFTSGESSPTFAEIRTSLVQNGWPQVVANACTPADAKGFQVGSGNGNLAYARMMARNTSPTLAELDAMASSSAADTSAWADYQLAWENGAANLMDRSGNGRDLSLAGGGTPHQGTAGPDL